MNLVTVAQAAETKGISRQAILKAIERGDIDGERLGPRATMVKSNKRFAEWEPMLGKQKGGFARAKKAKKG